MFAKAPLRIFTGALCLPPETTLSLSASDLVLENPFCRISFSLADVGTVYNFKPGPEAEVIRLESGESQYETRPIVIRVDVTYFALRAQHRQSTVYKDWASRVVAESRQLR